MPAVCIKVNGGFAYAARMKQKGEQQENMTNRERIVALMKGEPVDRKPFFFYFTPLPGAPERWEREGLKGDYRQYFGMDAGIEVVKVNLGFCPEFEECLIRDEGDRQVIRDSHGILMRVDKKGISISQVLENPVKCREDWEALKERLDPDDPRRFPENWPELVEHYRTTDALLQLGEFPYGLFGTLRDLVGAETLLYWFCEEPELVADMMDYLTDFWIKIYEKVVREVHVDAIHMWEDMSYRNGSLISNRMVRQFMVPNYQKIRDFARAHDITILSLDTDGDCSKLIPPFMEGGINLLMPFEVQAGSDVCAIAKQYPELGIMGGFNKQAAWTSKEAIDREFERLAPMFEPGVKYFFAMDHLIPPEVSFENLTYFMERAKQALKVV